MSDRIGPGGNHHPQQGHPTMTAYCVMCPGVRLRATTLHLCPAHLPQLPCIELLLTYAIDLIATTNIGATIIFAAAVRMRKSQPVSDDVYEAALLVEGFHGGNSITGYPHGWIERRLASLTAALHAVRTYQGLHNA